MNPQRRWAEMTWEDFAGADTSAWIAVLPVAAVEQHGPHLPLSVDADIARAYLAEAERRLRPDLPVTFLPLQSIGASAEHVGFPGTLSLSAATMTSLLTDLGESVARAGLRKLVIVNSHGGNVPMIDIAARDLRVRRKMLVVVAAWHRFGYPDGLFSAEERRIGIHAGDIETSLMLAACPELVRAGRAARFASAALTMQSEFKWLNADRPAGFAWMAQDLHPSGAVGDATLATRAKGEAAIAHGAQAFAELLEDVARFDLARLDGGPQSA